MLRIMNEFTDQYVLGVEHNIQDDISQDELIRHLKPIGLTAFSLLMLSMPDEKLPKISKILPTMASEDVQKSWDGMFRHSVACTILGFRSYRYNRHCRVKADEC